MILYFSSTGNSKYIATLLGKRMSSDVVNLLPYIKENKQLVVDDPSTVIICLPVYICSIPTFLIKFLKTIKFTHAKNCYFIFTNGGYDGMAKFNARRICKAWKIKYKGSISIKMPNNYIVNNHYAQTTDEESLRRIQQAAKSIEGIADAITNLKKYKHRYVCLLEYLITIPFVPIYSKKKFLTKDFYTTDKCKGCSICEKKCPLNIIKMVDHKPVWVKDHCAHCMGCINNCPQKAIEYGDATKGHMRALDYIDYGWCSSKIPNNEFGFHEMIKLAGFDDIYEWVDTLNMFIHGTVSFANLSADGGNNAIEFTHYLINICAKLFDHLCCFFHLQFSISVSV